MDRHDDIQSLRDQLEASLRRIKELETDKNVPQSSVARQTEAVLDVAPINESDITLRRLIQRIAMILQAEKILIMFHDAERGELKGIPPAFGIEEEKVTIFRVRATHGLSGLVFREAQPAIFLDALKDPRTQEEPFELLHVHNGLTVPLVIEKRDEENRVVDRTTIGVLHAFNKRHGEEFNEEDVRLLERMARNVGSIIANLQMFRQVVEEREELLQTFESLTAGLILISPEGRVSQVNSTARHLFNVGSESIGKMAQEVILNNEFMDAIFDARTGGEGRKREITVFIGGSERIYEIQAAQVRGEENKDLGVVAILNDITDMKNIDKMKSSFVAMASHELRTPLTAIKGFSSTLLDGLDEDMYGKEDQREFLGIVVSECDRLRRLIDDLLNTSRIEAGESLKPNYTEFDLLPLLERVVRVQHQVSPKHQVNLIVHDTMPKSIIGDEDKVDQIFTNLLNNAIKYSPNGGKVTVHAWNEGETLLFGVEDEGLGIPKEHLTKVFEKFHRVNNEDNRKIYGTGLGLFLVHHLVEQVHMGEIWVESEVNVGSMFKFRIPTRIDLEKAKAANS